MLDSGYHFLEKGPKAKLRATLEEIWPVINRNVEGWFYGLINFVKDMLASPFRKY